MKRKWIVSVAMLIVVILTVVILLSFGEKASHDGRYVAINPPTESGEMVIKELYFQGEQVTMISDDVEQTVKYKMEGNQFILITDYGSFSYPMERKENQFIIDNVTYMRQGG